MKTQTLFLIAVVVISFSSCKKNNEEIKDIKPLFSDTTWIGEFKYASRPIAEPFCIRFNAAGTFTWHELGGDYAGTYTVNTDSKTVVFTFSTGQKVTGKVTNDYKLLNFEYGGSYSWVINTLELVTTAGPELPDTNWTGENEGIPVTMRFTSVYVDYLTTGVAISPTYQAKNSSVRFGVSASWKFFGLIKNRQIIGIEQSLSTLGIVLFKKWQVTKQ
jgi:hypothetical protein